VIDLTKPDDPEDNPTLRAWTPRKRPRISNGSGLSDIFNAKGWGDGGEHQASDKQRESEVISKRDVYEGETDSPVTSPYKSLLTDEPTEPTSTPSSSQSRTKTPSPRKTLPTLDPPVGARLKPSEPRFEKVFLIIPTVRLRADC
jgi:hypothetical protein